MFNIKIAIKKIALKIVSDVELMKSLNTFLF